MIRPWDIQPSATAAALAASLCEALPVLRTRRCILRAPLLTDVPAWNAVMVPDAEGHLGGPHTEDEAYTEFAAYMGGWLLRGHGPWTVTDHSGHVLGFVLVGVEPGDQSPELGWLFLPEARGKGYATEAAAAARDHALGTLGLPRLVSYVDPANPASSRVAERLGAVCQGHYDGAQVWLHRLAASTAPATQTRHTEDAARASNRGH